MSEPKQARREAFPWYSMAAAVFPVLAFYSANVAILPLRDAGRPLAVALLVALGFQFVLSLALRDARRGAGATLVVVGCLWTFDHIYPACQAVLDGTISNALATLAILVPAALVAWLRPPARPLNTLCGMVALVAAINLGWVSARPPVPLATAQALSKASPLPAGPRPDVIHVVLDGFGREDELRRVIGVDLSWFTEGLRARGFDVADKARSNYVQTELSIASTLNMDFLPPLLPGVSPEEPDRRVLDPLIEESAVARRFQASGYRYLAIGSGFEGLRFGNATVPMSTSRYLTLGESELLARTPWLLRSEMNESQFHAHRERIREVFDKVAELGERTPVPRFAFVHVLAPHPPFVLDSNGEARPRRGPFAYMDASDYMTYVGTPQTYREGYSGQVQYVAKRLLAAVDNIIRANPDAVIILQGDHGSKLGLDQASLARTDVREAFGILYAVRAPAALRTPIAPLASPVNTYRRLFTAMGAKDLPPRPDRSWYSTYPVPFAFTEVTERLNGSASK